MADSSAARRLSAVASTLKTGASGSSANTLPWNPDATSFPSRKELPNCGENAPEGAAWVWGEDDQLGRINLLTPTRVAAAAKECIKDGSIASLNLPLDKPLVPGFGREPFKHHIKPLVPGIAYDDMYVLNTQSGTQWDGFRHIAHVATQQFYNGCTGAHIDGPGKDTHRCSIHHWGLHGIGGRGMLIDYWGYAKANGVVYDPYEYHAITYDELKKAAKSQGIDLRPQSQGGDIKIGDILLIRSGFVDTYNTSTPERRKTAALRGMDTHDTKAQRWAGVSADDDMMDFIHDSYFAAVAGDAPSFEAWPTQRPDGKMLHESILALWGMPLGEMFDLERVTEMCREKGRWTFFFSSAPANVPGGVGSHANAQAFF